MLDYQAILEEIHTSLKKIENTGEVASYIPELANIPKNKLGIHLQLITGENYSVGDSSEKFSIQSISKVFSLAKAFQLVGNDLWERVDVEPSGNPFTPG